MVIQKVINNNVISAYDVNRQEVVIMGKGIGFKAHTGDLIDEGRIEKVFRIENEKLSRQFQEIRENGGLKFGTYARKADTEKSPEKLRRETGNKSFDEAKVQAIREELTKKVVNRDTYNLAYSEASYDGQNRCQIVLAVMLTLVGMCVLSGVAGVPNAGRGALMIVLLIAGAAACAVIYSGKKVRQKNALIRMILEQELAEYQTVVEAAGQKEQREEETDTVQEQAEDSTECTEENEKEETQPEKKDLAAVEQETEPESQIKIVSDTTTEPLKENKAVNA